MFVYQSRFLRRGEVWFNNEPSDSPVDWILYRNRSRPAPRARWRYFYNRLIDLSKASDELLGEMEPKTVTKIKTAAEEDQLKCKYWTVRDGREINEIEGMWNQSTEAKRRWGQLNRQWFQQMLERQVLEFAATFDSSGKPVVFAGLFRDKNRVQQLMSVSPPRASMAPSIRAKTNRASCFLIWNTMLRLKEEGIRHFDFGGWYPGTNDIQLLGANAFKRGFGGEVVREFECEQIKTLKGWLVLTTARLIARGREFRSKTILLDEKYANEATA